jgi:HK97 family phage portal protein
MNIFTNFFTRKKPLESVVNRSVDLFGSIVSGRNTVNKNTLESISSVHASIRLLSETIATLPISLFKESGENKTVDFENKAYQLINKRPNTFQTPYQWKEWLMRSLLINGNAIFVIVWDLKRMQPKEFIPVDYSRVEIKQDKGFNYYDIDSGELVLEQSHVLHFKINSEDGIKGRGILDFAKDSLTYAKNLDTFGSKFFENGTQLTGVLQSDKTLSEKAIDMLRKTWNQKYGGVGNSNGVAILEDGLKFQPINISPEQAQFLQSRKFSKNEIAAWFKIPPHMIGDLERATFSNIEHQNLNFVQFSLMPYVVNIEQELNMKLLKEDEVTSMFFKMNMNAILRGDIKSRFESYQIGINNGFLSPNEARSLEDLNPYEYGNDFFMPLNMSKNNSEQKQVENGK